MEHDHSAWETVVQAATEQAASRQQALIERLGEDAQYNWDLERATINWSRGGRVYCSARITLIGTVSGGTWLWSWANDSLPDAAMAGADKIREYGVLHGFPVLPWESFRHHPELLKEARVVSAAVLDAAGLWADQAGDVQLHFLLHDLSGS